MKAIRYIFISIVIGVISGCAAMGAAPKNPNAEFVQSPPPPEGKINLYFVRIYAEPYMRGMTLYLNGKKVAKLSNYSYTSIAISPGQYKLKSEWGWDTGKPTLEFDIDVKGEMFIAFGGGLTVSGNTNTWRSEAYEIPKEEVEKSLKGTVFTKPLLKSF